MTTRKDIDEAINFEQSQPLPAWWESASQADRDEYTRRKDLRIAELRRMQPDGVTVYPAAHALDDGAS